MVQTIPLNQRSQAQRTCQSLHVDEVLEQAKPDYGAEVTKAKGAPGRGWKEVLGGWGHSLAC